MRFSLSLSMLFAASAIAAPTALRSPPSPPTGQSTPAKILKGIDSALLQTTAAVTALIREANGRDTSMIERDIETKARSMVLLMQTGSLEIRRSPAITLVAFNTNVSPVMNEVDAHTRTVVQAFIDAKKYVVSTPGGREAVLMILNDHAAAAGALGDAVKSRLPAGSGLSGLRFIDHPQFEIKRAIFEYSRP